MSNPYRISEHTERVVPLVKISHDNEFDRDGRNGGLGRSKSDKDFFRAEGSIPEKVHGIWNNIAHPQKLR